MFRIITFTIGCILLLASHNTQASNNLAKDFDWSVWNGKLNHLRQSHQIPGMSVAVVKDGQMLWGRGFGYADNEQKVPITANTPFWIASITKTFVALTFLHLAEQGKINLDELASETPKFKKLCHWLANTSIPFASGLDCAQPITIRHILHHQNNAPVGQSFMYNPIMYSRLSRYLEHKFGQGVEAVEGRHNALGQFIDNLILEPAGMQRTMASMWDKSRVTIYQELAVGFKVDAQGVIHKQPQPEKHIAGGAGIVSTANDLAKYEIAIQSGLIAQEVIRAKLEQPANFTDGEAAPYGFGWYFQQYQGEKLMWHSGWDPEAGYSAIYLRMPEHKLAFIVLANSEGLWWGNSLTKAEIQNSAFAQVFLQLAKKLK